jgi:hypothetical protein
MNPHWMELMLGKRVTLPVGGAFGAPVVVGAAQIAVRDGYLLHIDEVADGAYVLLVAPKDVARVGEGAGFWVGIADAIGGVATKLGDWVAGWFPKAQEARLKKVQTDAKAARLMYNSSPERLAQQDQAAQMAAQIAAIVAALDDDEKPEVSGLPISVRRIEVGRAPRPQIPFGCSVRGPKKDCPCGCGGACGCGGHK